MTSLQSFPVFLRLTDGTVVPFEFTGYTVEIACRGAVARFQKANPTKRVEYAEVRNGDTLQRWLPHLEGWFHDQPDFVKDSTVLDAPLRRDGPNPVDGTEI